LGTRTRRVGVRQEPECCGLATAGAEIGRPAYIVGKYRGTRFSRFKRSFGMDQAGYPTFSSASRGFRCFRVFYVLERREPYGFFLSPFTLAFAES
jgi:hypothetical protein